jgi:hypothetical protein
MGRLADAAANVILDLAFSKASNTFPTTYYVGLSTTTPTNTGTNVTEPSGGSYTRVAVTNNATNFPAATARGKSNGTIVTFPAATADWGIITHFVIYDAASAGTFWAWGELTAPVDVTSATQASFGVGALVINAPGA